MTKAASARLISAISKWNEALNDYPGWKEWKRKRLAFVLSAAEGIPIHEDLQDFELPEILSLQHDALMRYFGLHTSFFALQQCEFYFRRYPFRGLPVTKHEHIRNICEMYFNRIYEFRERMKTCLNAVNRTLDSKFDVGAVLKAFDKDFDQEIRARHRVHHHEAFDDLALEGISVASLIAMGSERDLGWGAVAERSYRATAKEWAQRVQKRSHRAEVYLDAVAGVILTHCRYLSDE